MQRFRLRTIAKAVAAGLTLAVACTFASYDVAVPYPRLYYPLDGALSVSSNGSHLFAVDLLNDGSNNPRYEVYDAATGTLVASKWWSSNWGVVAAAPDHSAGYESVAWALHANGYRIRWNNTLSGYSEIEVPIPTTGATAADNRMYCDMDRDAGGVTYLTTIDWIDGSPRAFLYREPYEAVWERTELPSLVGKCGRVAYDLGSNQAFVLDVTTDELLVYDADTLVLESSTDLSAMAGDATDIASIGSQPIVTFRRATSTHDAIVAFDANGNVDDQQTLLRAAAVTVGVANNEARLWWSGWDSYPIKYAIGSFKLQ